MQAVSASSWVLFIVSPLLSSYLRCLEVKVSLDMSRGGTENMVGKWCWRLKGLDEMEDVSERTRRQKMFKVFWIPKGSEVSSDAMVLSFLWSAGSRLVDPVPQMNRAVWRRWQQRPRPVGMPKVRGDHDIVPWLRWHGVATMHKQGENLLELPSPAGCVVDLDRSTESWRDRGKKSSSLLLHVYVYVYST